MQKGGVYIIWISSKEKKGITSTHKKRRIKMVKNLNTPPTHAKLVAWVNEWAELCEPEGIHWCDGTNTEYYGLCDEMVKSGLATRLNNPVTPRWCTSMPASGVFSRASITRLTPQAHAIIAPALWLLP